MDSLVSKQGPVSSHAAPTPAAHAQRGWLGRGGIDADRDPPPQPPRPAEGSAHAQHRQGTRHLGIRHGLRDRRLDHLGEAGPVEGEASHKSQRIPSTASCAQINPPNAEAGQRLLKPVLHTSVDHPRKEVITGAAIA